MDNLFSYYDYEQVICFTIDENKDLRICRSSNRLIEMEEIKRIGVGTIVNKQHGISVKNMFSKYFQIYWQDKELQIEDETGIIALITNFMQELRQSLIQDSRTVFEKSQILFCLPLEWTEENHKKALRKLFLESEWITAKDHRNRLIFSAFTERLVNYLQSPNNANKVFQRERKYLFCYIDETSLRFTCVQMQNAVELVAISKKLAASDFFLTPTILDDESISLLSFDAIIYRKIKDMINSGSSFSNKQRNKVHNKPGRHTLIGKIVKNIAYIYAADRKGKYDISLDELLSKHSSFFEYKSVQELLKGWTCSTFMNEILSDTQVKRFIEEGMCSIQRLICKYSPIKNSPEGVQDIILFTDCENSNAFYKSLIRDVLLNADIINNHNKFIDIFDDMKLCEGAAQKPYKMIQIANALLPPVICDETNSTILDLTEYSRPQETDLLPPNLFYLQSHIHKDCISFILNKVVAVSLEKTTLKKATFTVREETLSMESIVDLACDFMWDHYQNLVDFGYEEGLSNNCCDLLSGSNYYVLNASLKDLIDSWLHHKRTSSDQDIDCHQTILTNSKCGCSLAISRRMLLEIGLKPAIENVAATIVSGLVSNDLFGRYAVSALIITGGTDIFAEDSYHRYYNRSIFEDSVYKYLQIHQRAPTVFFGKEDLMKCEKIGKWAIDKQQILGRGNYIQLSSASYGIRIFSKGIVQHGSFNGMFEYDGYSYKKSPRVVRAFPNLIILSRNDHLTHEGCSKTLVLHNYNIRRIGLYTLNSSGSDTNWQRIWFPSSFQMNHTYPLTIKIMPQNDSSTINVEFSFVKQAKTPVLHSESITIHERLILKRKRA